MTTEERLKWILAATPEQLAEFDALRAGATRTVPSSLRLLRVGQAARETGLSRCTIWRAVRDGRLKVVEIRAGSHRIPECELRRFAGAGP